MTFGPNFLNAQFEGVKSVPPVCGASFRASERPVLSRPSCNVENSPGRREMMVVAGGGGRRRESTAWITPLVPNCWRGG